MKPISPGKHSNTAMQAYLHSAAFWNLYSKGIITAKDLQENEKFFTTLVHAIAPRNC